jgi:phosphoglycerol transferase MdoB-like AlkP superfamily enzyme
LKERIRATIAGGGRLPLAGLGAALGGVMANPDKTIPSAADSSWKVLYRVAAAAALLTVLFIPIQITVFIAWPPPGYDPAASTVAGWFTLLHSHKLVGLLDLDLLLIVDQVLAVPIFLALYAALRRASAAIMALATVLGLVAIAVYFASNATFSMLALSDQYAAASTDAQKSLILAAGQAVFAMSTGTAFHVGYILGSVALVMTSIVMLRSGIFSKATAYVGILGSVIGLGLYVPKIGLFLSIASVPFLAVWNILIAKRLFALGRSVD